MKGEPRPKTSVEVSDVHITVLPGVERRPWRERVPAVGAFSTSHRTVSIVLVLGAIASLATAVLVTGADRRERSLERVGAANAGSAAVAAAYGYPMRCLSVTILPDYPTYARADFDHLYPCGRYTGYPTVIFRHVHGGWRIVLDATAYSCPVASIPVGVQQGLDICAGSAG
jgi:hypothetical protein